MPSVRQPAKHSRFEFEIKKCPGSGEAGLGSGGEFLLDELALLQAGVTPAGLLIHVRNEDLVECLVAELAFHRDLLGQSENRRVSVSVA